MIKLYVGYKIIQLWSAIKLEIVKEEKIGKK